MVETSNFSNKREKLAYSIGSQKPQKDCQQQHKVMR